MAEQTAIKTGDVEILFRSLKDPATNARYDGDERVTRTLPAGFTRTAENRAFSVATVYDKDVEIVMRDGTILKGDVFRPDVSGPVPAILPWSPYGKSGRGMVGYRGRRKNLWLIPQ